MTDCVEVARAPAGRIVVRNSKSPGAGVLQVTRDEWRSFMAAVRVGALDR
jgi:hypothetical protein